MGYYSLRDPIHNNDIINNGAQGLVYWSSCGFKKKHLMELLILNHQSWCGLENTVAQERERLLCG